MERLKLIGKALSGKNGLFSAKQISEESGVPVRETEVILDRLEREGLLGRYRFQREFAPVGRGRPKSRVIYQVIEKRKLQSRVAPKLREDTAQDRAWRIIRARVDFSLADVIELAEIKRENARLFLKMLRRAGYVMPLKKGGPGVRWMLIKDPGPRRPYVGDQSLAKRIAHSA